MLLKGITWKDNVIRWKLFFLGSGRAGYKLEAAIEQLGIDVEGKIALDSGLSTGGFTDCLLQHGASFVYGVDVGYGQVFCSFNIMAGFYTSQS